VAAVLGSEVPGSGIFFRIFLGDVVYSIHLCLVRDRAKLSA
jgi:hypothetical protein